MSVMRVSSSIGERGYLAPLVRMSCMMVHRGWCWKRGRSVEGERNSEPYERMVLGGCWVADSVLNLNDNKRRLLVAAAA